MADGVGKQVSTFAFASRLLLILFQFLANILIPDHDAQVFKPPVEEKSGFSAFDDVIELTVWGLKRWDAVYFVHIAEYGYTFENCAAFFPLFPLFVRLFAKCISFLGILHLHSSIIFVAVVINCLLFSFTAKNLYTLGLKVGLDSKVSFLSSILFCVNPSSVFMTAPYSETLYMFLLVYSLILLQDNDLLKASFFIGLSIFTRSNGLVGIGFLIHSVVSSFVRYFQIKSHQLLSMQSVFYIFCSIGKLFISVLICVIPFILYQYYIFLEFCFPFSVKGDIPDHIISYGRSMNYKIVGDSPSPWCENVLPFSYSYIQTQHWGVGFLKYYELKQIPNFLLAAPVIYCSFQCCLYFFNLNRGIFYGLGLLDLSRWKEKRDPKVETQLARTAMFSSRTAVFIFHLAFLVIFGCFFVHIQVLTRMLFSSSPLLYWYCGLRLQENSSLSKFAEDHIRKIEEATCDSSHKFENFVPRKRTILGRRILRTDTRSYSDGLGLQLLHCVHMNWGQLSRCTQAILVYFVSYFFIGTLMFCNFLPWT